MVLPGDSSKKYLGILEDSHWGTGVLDTKNIGPAKPLLKKSSYHLMKEFELLQSFSWHFLSDCRGKSHIHIVPSCHVEKVDPSDHTVSSRRNSQSPRAPEDHHEVT